MGFAGHIIGVMYMRLFSWIDPRGIGLLVIVLIMILGITVLIWKNERVSFKCPHCNNIFSKYYLGGEDRYVRRRGKDSEELFKCPFCKKENMCLHIDK